MRLVVPVASGATEIISSWRAPRRPPPCPQRVLAARRRLQDRCAGGPGGRARDARARAHRSRRDERRGRALQGVQGERDQADPRARGLPGRRPSPRRCSASSATTSPCWRPPRPAFATWSSSTSAGFLEGFGRGKPSVDTELLDRHSDGVIALTGCLQSRFCRRLVEERPGRRPGAPRRADRRLRPRERLLRDPGQRAAPSRTRRTRASSASPASSAGRWWRPPTSTTCAARTTRTTRRCSACRRSRRSSSRSCASRPTSSSSRARPRWPSRSPRWPESVPTTLEIAERCEVEIELGQLLLPRFPTPDGEEPARDAPAARHRGAAAPLRRPAAGRGRRAARVRARGDRARWASSPTS